LYNRKARIQWGNNWGEELIYYFQFTIDYWHSAEGGIGNAVMAVL